MLIPIRINLGLEEEINILQRKILLNLAKKHKMIDVLCGKFNFAQFAKSRYSFQVRSLADGNAPIFKRTNETRREISEKRIAVYNLYRGMNSSQ